jgi:hypothetical protein
MSAAGGTQITNLDLSGPRGALQRPRGQGRGLTHCGREAGRNLALHPTAGTVAQKSVGSNVTHSIFAVLVTRSRLREFGFQMASVAVLAGAHCGPSQALRY